MVSNDIYGNQSRYELFKKNIPVLSIEPHRRQTKAKKGEIKRTDVWKLKK